MPPMVSATAAPTTSGPSRLNTPARTTACSGRAARVATSVAIAFDASWNPLVTAKAKASASATPKPACIAGPYGRMSERDRQREDRRRDDDDREQHRDEGRVLDHSWEPVFVVVASPGLVDSGMHGGLLWSQ